MKNSINRAIRYIFKGVPVNNITASVYTLTPDNRLKGRRIIITGGGRGLGFYIAKKCQEEGASILIVGRNEETLKQASHELGQCPYIAADLQDVKRIKGIILEASEKLNGVDSLVNNAGISLHEKSFFDVTEDTFDKQFNTNIKAPYFLSQEFIKYAKNNGQNSLNILFITSERGLYGDVIPYGLTKAAINSLTHGLARAFVTKGVRVNAIAPGVTASDMTGFNKDGNLYRPQSCGKRVLLPEEIAETAVFLLSQNSGCISGEIIPCNEGNHLRSDY
jgi:NAD(P)-dependent dehydrogenase (short-subunit alcohol dehydrogenase family)